jgi:hypothetical protein
VAVGCLEIIGEAYVTPLQQTLPNADKTPVLLLPTAALELQPAPTMDVQDIEGDIEGIQAQINQLMMMKQLQDEISKLEEQLSKQKQHADSAEDVDSVVIGTPEKVQPEKVQPEKVQPEKVQPEKVDDDDDDDDSASEASSVSSDSDLTTSTTSTSVSDVKERLRQVRVDRLHMESGNGFANAVNDLYEKMEDIHRKTRRPGTFNDFATVVSSAMALQDKLARDKKPTPSGVAQVSEILLDNAVANELCDLKNTGKSSAHTKRTIANMAACATVDAIFKMLYANRMFEHTELRLIAQAVYTDDIMKRYVHPKLASFQDVDMESLTDVTKITVCKFIAMALVNCAEASR